MDIISRIEAKNKGLKTYFTGQLCAKGHLSERYVSDPRCVQCNTLKNLKWRQIHYVEKPLSIKQQAIAEGRNRYFTGIPCINGHVCERKTNRGRCVECDRIVKRIAHRKYKKRNKGVVNANTAKRRARKLQACPSWARVGSINEQLRKIYKNCPKGYHVDHIVPLQGETVCGLHVPWNLQYLTEFDNCSKHNKLEVKYL